MFKLGQNQCVRNLFQLISAKTDLSRAELKLTHNHHEIMDSDCLKTISELGLKNLAVLHLVRGTPPRRPLLNPTTKELTPTTKEIFTTAFNEYAKDGKMTKDDFSDYYRRYSYSGLSMDSYKLDNIFRDREFLTLDNFLKYYER